MKALRIDQYGGAEQLTEHEVPEPAPGPGQVVIRNYAVSFNPIDVKLATGDMRDFAPLTLPWTPGADFSGTVESVGEGVTDLREGDDVYGFSSSGGTYAESIVIDAKRVGFKPNSLNHIEAAALALVGQTALQALNAGDLRSGQTVLIHGASGGVGNAAVQIAFARGALVIATGALESLESLREIGASNVIDYKTTQFESVVKDVDFVLDTIGGDTQSRSFPVLKPGGILVALTQPPPEDAAGKYGIRTVMLDTQSSRASLGELTRLIDAKKVRPNVGMTTNLSDAPRVWRDLRSLKVSGKIVFVVRTS